MLANVYTASKGVRRLLWAIALLGCLAVESVKDALRNKPQPEHFRFTQRDLDEEMPLSVERYRWTQGGIA